MYCESRLCATRGQNGNIKMNTAAEIETRSRSSFTTSSHRQINTFSTNKQMKIVFQKQLSV